MVTQYYCICVFSESKSLRLQWSRLSYLWDLQLFRVSTAKSSVRMCFKGNGSCLVCKQAQVKLDIYTDRFSANDLGTITSWCVHAHHESTSQPFCTLCTCISHLLVMRFAIPIVALLRCCVVAHCHSRHQCTHPMQRAGTMGCALRCLQVHWCETISESIR